MSLSSSDISLNEKYILHYIKNVTEGGKQFFQNDETLAIVLEMTPKSVKRLIYKLIQNGYLTKVDTSGGKRCLQYTGKEFTPLAIYPSYKDINIKLLLAENKKLKKDLIALQSEYDTVVVYRKNLESKIIKLNKKIELLQEERDNMIITIEDMDRELSGDDTIL